MMLLHLILIALRMYIFLQSNHFFFLYSSTLIFFFVFFSPARDLIRSMLSKNPDHRPTLEQIKNHPWMQSEVSAVSSTVKAIKNPMSPIKNTVLRLKETARASLSPVQSRRRRTSVL